MYVKCLLFISPPICEYQTSDIYHTYCSQDTLHAFSSYILQGMPECIKSYCRVGDNLDVASRYRILVTTCVSAGVLYGQVTHSQVIFYRVCLNV